MSCVLVRHHFILTNFIYIKQTNIDWCSYDDDMDIIFHFSEFFSLLCVTWYCWTKAGQSTMKMMSNKRSYEFMLWFSHKILYEFRQQCSIRYFFCCCLYYYCCPTWYTKYERLLSEVIIFTCVCVVCVQRMFSIVICQVSSGY